MPIKRPMHIYNSLFYQLLWLVVCLKCFVLFAFSTSLPCGSSASLLICVGVDCLRVVSRVKNLKQWASVFSAKSLYKEWLREVKGDKAWCIVFMKYVEISGMESRCSQLMITWKEMTSNTDIPEKGVGRFFSITGNYKYDAKVVSKSALSKGGEHNKLNSQSPSLRVRKSVTCDETLKAEILWALKATMSHYSCKSCEGTSKLLQAMFNFWQ